MPSNMLFCLLSLSCLCLALAHVSYDDCCLKYVAKFGHRMQKCVVDYKQQKTDGSCNIPAIIFIMRKGRVFCTDPQQKWVVELMKKVKEKKAKTEAQNKNQQHEPKRG